MVDTPFLGRPLSYTPKHLVSLLNVNCTALRYIIIMEDQHATECGYFPMLDRSGSESPDSIRSSTMSIPMSSPTVTTAAVAALQYLPVPLLVLSTQKTVVLANEAMGRLLDIDFESTATHELSISEVLQDKTMGELGIDILQNGSPILVTWEVRSFPTPRSLTQPLLIQS